MEIRNDRTDKSKVILAEEVYKKILTEYEDKKEIEIDKDYNYCFYLYGNEEDTFNTYLYEPEELEIRKKKSLYIVNGDVMDTFTNHFWNNQYKLANVIFHFDKETKIEDNYKEYLSKFNFFVSNVTVFSILISKDEEDKPKLDIYEQNQLHNECYIKNNIYIRTNEKDIPINEYITENIKNK